MIFKAYIADIGHVLLVAEGVFILFLVGGEYVLPGSASLSFSPIQFLLFGVVAGVLSLLAPADTMR